MVMRHFLSGDITCVGNGAIPLPALARLKVELGTDLRDGAIEIDDLAIGGGKGLVVPVLRNAERMSFAQIELAISDLARRAQQNKLKLEELQGGTFTISNLGVESGVPVAVAVVDKKAVAAPL